MRSFLQTILFFVAVLLCVSTAQAEPRYVSYHSGFGVEAGTIVIVLDRKKLFYVLNDTSTAFEYPIAVGKPGMDTGILGSWKVTKMVEWPTWTPPGEMIDRRPELAKWAGGMPGGTENPLGARALYLGNSLYRIHGTNEPSSIGKAVSSGCIRMLNEDVERIYQLVEEKASVQTVVVVQTLADLHATIY